MRIDNEAICFRHKEHSKNFGTNTGNEFAIYFKGKSSYYVYKDGIIEKAKDDAEEDRIAFEEDIKKSNGLLTALKFKDIVWGIGKFGSN